MEEIPKPKFSDRIGFHYYPDSLHYRDSDLQAWLPALHALGVSWLTLEAPAHRTIPESFLSGLLSRGIEPVLWFRPQLAPPNSQSHANDGKDWQLLLETYARWGVRYTLFFDRPNLRASWTTRAWVQSELVETFLDTFLPIAEIAVQTGLKPVFPPLEPGGDYWDTAFLKDCILAMLRRGSERILNSLTVAAHAHFHPGKLAWGMGGPERWPEARPYTVVDSQQDQRGFYIFEWYQAIMRAVLGQPRPIMLFEVGRKSQPDKNEEIAEQHMQIEDCLSVVRVLAGEEVEALNPTPTEVLAANFWLLADQPGGPFVDQAWFKPDGEQLACTQALSSWIAERRAASHSKEKIIHTAEKSISHYLLLPRNTASDFMADIRSFVALHHPTIGFSVQEACKAVRVSIFGGAQAFTKTDMEALQDAGCLIDHIMPAGMEFATTPSEAPTLETN